MEDFSHNADVEHRGLARFAVPGLLFLAGVLYGLPLAVVGLNHFDEGLRLNVAERVLGGEMPYQDFYLLYGPALAYWGALLFKLVGIQILSLRLGGVLFNAVAAVAVYGLSRNAGAGLKLSLLAFCSFLLPRQEAGWQYYVPDPSQVLVLVAGVVLTAGPIRRWRLLLTGAILGSGALFRIDFGVYGLLAGLAVLAWAIRASASQGQSIVTYLRQAGALLLGFLVIAGLGYGAVSARGIRPVIDNLFVYPAQTLPYRKTPFSLGDLRIRLITLSYSFRPGSHLPTRMTLTALADILVYFLPAAVVVLALAAFRPAAFHRLVGDPSGVVVYAASLTVLAIPYAVLGRSDYWHLFALYPPCCALIAILLGSQFGPSPWSLRAERLVRAIVGIMALALVVIFVGRVVDYRRAPRLDFPRTAGIVLRTNEDTWLFEAIRELDDVNPGSPIFVGCERHDLVHTNCQIAYFLSGRPTGTYWASFDPGLITSAPVQERIISDLERGGVDTVLLVPSPLSTEPNLSSHSSGVVLLDCYLQNRFEVLKKGGDHFRILRRFLDDHAAMYGHLRARPARDTPDPTRRPLGLIVACP